MSNNPELKLDTNTKLSSITMPKQSGVDLTMAEIHISTATPRVSVEHRAEIRPLNLRGTEFSQTQQLATSQNMESLTKTRRPRRRVGARYGLVKNAAFTYEGGTFSKLLSFLANALKLLEQLLLGKGKQETPAPQMRTQQNQLRVGTTSASEAKEEETEEALERLKRVRLNDIPPAIK